MLKIDVGSIEYYNNKTNTFLVSKPIVLQLEHSLVSLSKWESTWKKPFLHANDDGNILSDEEVLDYIRCMTITQNVNPDVYYNLSSGVIDSITKYIKDSMTATWFSELEQVGSDPATKKEIITSEIIYYRMITYNIPFECQKWHLNRLLTLIKVFNIKNTPDKKMSRSDIYARNRMLNAQRRARLKTRG